MKRSQHKTRCPECGQWRVVTLVKGVSWRLDVHQRPAFRGSSPCPWPGGLVNTAIVLQGVVIRPAESTVGSAP